MRQCGCTLILLPGLAAAEQTAPPAAPLAVSATPQIAAAPKPVVAPPSVLPATLPRGAPVLLMLNQELSTRANKIGDRFTVTVLTDVGDGAAVVIPKGTTGQGEVTFAAGTGGFGRAGMLMITLRTLDLGGRKVALEGRYRQEGADNNGATVATWVAVGVFSGFVKGKTGVIPKGRELKARTGEDISFVPGASPPAIPAAPPPPR